MLRLHRLFSEPEVFTPIEFHSGVNLILGERASETNNQGRKVNGVGKSVCVDFLHFALCRKYSDTRVSLIPESVVPLNLVVVLDLTINGRRLQIRRSIANHDQPTVIMDGESQVDFDSLEHATDYLGELLFRGQTNAGQVSFRQISSLLMRDERSGFKNLLNPHDTKSNIPDDIAPHLYLLGFDLTPYRRLESLISTLTREQTILKELRRLLTNSNQTKLSDIPSKLNEERQATRKIEDAITLLRADPAFEDVEGDMNQIEADLTRLRGERKAISYQIDQIRAIPLQEQIDISDMQIVYDRIKSGLGVLVVRSLLQAQAFKAEVESFQQALRQDHLVDLETRHHIVSENIRQLSDRHAELTRQIDRHDLLGELRTGFEVAVRRTDEYHRLESNYRQFQEKTREVEQLTADRLNLRLELNRALDVRSEIEQVMNETIVSFHEKIMGTSAASFRFVLSNSNSSKRPLSIDVRIQDDGSKSINQTRAFIYDMALMLNRLTTNHHPRFLLHDNILEVDQDTLIRCLNFLHEQISVDDEFQYILTLNRDKIEHEEQHHEILLDLDLAKCASFTKTEQFLRQRYQER